MAPQPTPLLTTETLSQKHFHLVGIGGCGMNGLARLLCNLGSEVVGTDAVNSHVTEALIHDGIPTSILQDGSTITQDIDIIVHSAAVPPDHPEILRGDELGIPVLTYAQMLGFVQSQHTGVCIAGTHGKSTTVSMLSAILLKAGFDPSFIVGANCSQIGGSSRVGSSKIPQGPLEGKCGVLVSESCEFNRSFHDHVPTIGLINNIEEDHLDYYSSLDAIIESFRKFAMRIPPSEDQGFLLIAHDGAHRNIVTPGLRCKVETFGFHPEADYQVVFDPSVRRVGILRDGMWTIQWTNGMPGSHNALNAAAAAILAANLGVDWESITAPLEEFEGVDRRLQKLGHLSCNDGGKAIVYDDYGHHPTEIEMTLRALRSAELPKRLFCVFQPHQHSRTRFLLEQFAQSFSSADEIIVPHIYFVRDSEAEQQRVSAQDLVDKLIDQGSSAKHIDDFDNIVKHLQTTARDGDLIVIMGAGPVTTIAHALVGNNKIHLHK
ncbi:MAG: UDP-N-acetylmuramate--L-alanine ligase [Phycisphaerales bacterium]|nr:UDP-N-acetylmuramate--L-alanine ligase [Planctomycetota bacterium]MBL6997685.1 UDP-N-acetylmuramate--L-alanine ligase [Phycisphaerales bacterium]